MGTSNQVNFRMPDDCRAFVTAKAEADACSKTSVIIRAIRQMATAEKANRPGAATPDRSEMTVSR